MDKKTLIGEKIKDKRLQLNLRMDDVAKHVGITRSTLWSIESGKGNYTIDVLLKLLDYLDLPFEIKFDESNTDRDRATRANSALDKKINRFLMMCIEQYASSINESSKATYEKMNNSGVLQELIDDYEDMHGMSTYSINDYIEKRLNEVKR